MNLSMKEKIVARRVLRALRDMLPVVPIKSTAEVLPSIDSDVVKEPAPTTDMTPASLIEKAAAEWGITLDAPSVEKPVRGRSTGAQILNNRTRPPRRN